MHPPENHLEVIMSKSLKKGPLDPLVKEAILRVASEMKPLVIKRKKTNEKGPPFRCTFHTAPCPGGCAERGWCWQDGDGEL